MKYRYWIFDLDNTLHFADIKIFPLVNKKMDAYIQNKLNISKKKSALLRQYYWDVYGATLPGLIKHHQINPQDFLKITHDLIFNNDTILFPKNIKHTLKNIPVRKLVFTNAPKAYSEKILKHMKIYRLFNGVHSIEDSNSLGKPNQHSFHQLFKDNKFKRGVMIDDVKENLIMAKKMGLITIWFSKERYKPNYVDYKIFNLQQLKRLRIS